MSWRNYCENPAHVIASTQQLMRAGATERELAAEYGIFAFDAGLTHLHLERNSSRLRAPGNSGRALTARNRGGIALHWSPLLDASDGSAHSVGVRDCLAQMVRCQEERMAIAAIDNALHRGLIDIDAVTDLFESLPRRFRRMRRRINGRSESGQESVLRLIVEDMGLDVQIQVVIDGVGRVDMVVAGVLVVEADSRAHHKEWDQHVRDRTRDRLLAARGYMTMRLLYRDIMFDADGVRAAIRGLLGARR